MIDGSNNIAVCSGAAATAQDVACAVMLFKGELYYDTTQGVPYMSKVFGQLYSKSIAQALIQKAALTVPYVVAAQATITGFAGRRLSGNVKVIDKVGQQLGVSF
jgi:hypothetical protein